MSRPPSIRDQLEQQAWSRHPEFAGRQAVRTSRQSRSFSVTRCGHSISRRGLAWPDRVLLIVAALLLVLLIARVETARAESADAALPRIEQPDAAGPLPAQPATAQPPGRTGTIAGAPFPRISWPTRVALALLSLFLATGMLLYVPDSRDCRTGGARQPGASRPG